MKTSDFNYILPHELIAQHPLECRTASRLLVLDKNDGSIEHKTFENLLVFLTQGDCLVLNDTKVIPARIFGKKIPSGGSIEFVLLKHLDSDKFGNDAWEVILKPGRKAKIGTRFEFGDGKLIAEVIDIIDDGKRIVRFAYKGVFVEILEHIGTMPLPPYITEKLDDQTRYQTVYALNDGSAAAPTAGLHFTPEFLEKIRGMGVEIAYLTLHVGLGTFRPVKVEEVLNHHMHSEQYSISAECAEKINFAKRNANKIFSVGTTTTRVLESVSDENGFVSASEGETSIFIYPGYKFKCVDSLITNFHLPESTLIMLVSAFASRETVLKAYEEAVAQQYRFFSFGDAMLIK
ncbi:MAG: tRNA preQ1(34) S-adenosylmethionine ribosyltransferase-isomerase QueA [Bacillota bacterium]